MHLKFNRILRCRKGFFTQQFGADAALFKLFLSFFGKKFESQVTGLLGFSEGAGRVGGRGFLKLPGQEIDCLGMAVPVQEAGNLTGAALGGVLLIVFQAMYSFGSPASTAMDWKTREASSERCQGFSRMTRYFSGTAG